MQFSKTTYPCYAFVIFFEELGTQWLNKSRLAHFDNKSWKQEGKSIFGRMEKSGKQELEEKKTE